MYFAKEEFLNQTRLVFLDEQKVPVEFFVLRKNDIVYGDIYRARISGKAEKLKSYFADIDLQRTVFLKHKKELPEGLLLTVQINQEPRLDKIACARSCADHPEAPVGLVEKAPLPDTSDRIEIPWNEEIEEAFEELQNPIVNFADGAHLIFERTHAFWSIDVDSGKSTQISRELNRLAVPIIALEIVRRNLSGNILIDFIGYKKREELRDYIPIFKEYLSQSHVSYSIAGRSPLGNFEIRRSRHRACLLDVLSSPAALAYRFFREICRSKTPIKQATVGPVLYKALNTQLAEDWEMAQKRNGQDIKLTVDPEMKEYQI